MKLEIGKPVKPEKLPKSKFKLVVEVMHGDADEYTTEEGLFTEEQKDDLIILLECFKRLEKVPSGYEHDEYGDIIEEFEKEKGLPEKYYLHDKIREYIPGDITCDHDGWAQFKGYTLTWFNENSTEYEVKVKK